MSNRYETAEDGYESHKQGLLTEAEHAALEARLEGDAAFAEQWEELLALDEQMEQAPLVMPDPAIAQHFEQLLAEEKAQAAPATPAPQGKHLVLTPMQVAASVALLVVGLAVGWLLGNQKSQNQLMALQSDITQMQQVVMLSQLNGSSPSERLQVLQASTQYESANNEMVLALMATLNGDTNTNVRLAAAEALGHFAHQPEVRRVLSNSLLQQDDPTVQLVIIDILVNRQETSAVDELQQLAQDDEVLDIVKKKAQEGLGRLL